jgi:mannose/fructose-specific phosphotransferase system component IIA
MTKILFCSHGRMASGMKSSLEILVGKTDSLETFDAYVEENTDIACQIKSFFERYPDENKVLLSDIYGGSVNQAMYQFADRENTTLITGVNLPLLLEMVVAANNDLLDEDRIKAIVKEAGDLIKIVEVKNTVTEEDFF